MVIGHGAVHPRACGERLTLAFVPVLDHGSSPRLRGTARSSDEPHLLPRFIPAPAGNGRHTIADVFGVTVHPRACGERDGLETTVTISSGSSPRLRGTAQRWQAVAIVYRFIPAPAGNGPSNRPWSTFTAVHPRACGERRALYGKDALLIGSSPRLRGTAN